MFSHVYEIMYKLTQQDKHCYNVVLKMTIVCVYEDNPYAKNNNTTKMTVRDLQIEYNNNEVLNYFKSMNTLCNHQQTILNPDLWILS